MRTKRNLYFKLLLSGLVFSIASQIIHMIGIFISRNYYTMPEFAQTFNPLFLPSRTPPPPEFILLVFVFGMIQGVLISYIYYVLNKGVPGKTPIKKGLIYGNVIYIITTVSGSFAMILMVKLPLMIVAAWAIENLITYLIFGLFIGWLIDY